MKNNLVEITDLSDDEYVQMNHEIKNIAAKFKEIMKADKLNIASIGNVVSQLHIHIIARYTNDKLFPKPVWGSELVAYSKDELNKMIDSIREF